MDACVIRSQGQGAIELGERFLTILLAIERVGKTEVCLGHVRLQAHRLAKLTYRWIALADPLQNIAQDKVGKGVGRIGVERCPVLRLRFAGVEPVPVQLRAAIQVFKEPPPPVLRNPDPRNWSQGHPRPARSAQYRADSADRWSPPHRGAFGDNARQVGN